MTDPRDATIASLTAKLGLVKTNLQRANRRLKDIRKYEAFIAKAAEHLGHHMKKLDEANKRAETAEAELERVKREREEWQANSQMYEATAKEAARGLECLNEIDEAWDAFGTAGNRKALTLAEQIASQGRELEALESTLAKEREEKERLEAAWSETVNLMAEEPKFNWEDQDGKRRQHFVDVTLRQWEIKVASAVRRARAALAQGAPDAPDK